MQKPKEKQLYINVFAWNKIPAPKSDDDPIPVFGRELATLTNDSYVNIAFNTQILEKYGKNGPNAIERDMLVKLAFQYVESQNKCEINQYRYEIVTDFTCFGELNDCIHNLSRTKNAEQNASKLELAKEALDSIESNKNNLPDSILSKIANLNMNNSNLHEEKKITKPVKIADEKKPLLIEELNAEQLACPTYEEIISTSKKDSNLDTYEVKISLPKISSMNECRLDVDDSATLTLSTDEFLYKKLTISLSKLKVTHEIMIDDIEAKFVKKTSTLRVKIPMVKLDK